ncbi:hypothetical protein NBRC116188_06520 [Oceaniserpentilla sp. 4NH20-0058]|uniref:TFIIB-type zinc ribbon-containing protein n=1 Tax=Oceaniserpentilla sp. 4NH20-0058 TaxID=3127660 RepID=UPI003101BE44
MQCPSCKTTRLLPTKLEARLPAMGCKTCEGALLSLLYYRDWAEQGAVDEQATCSDDAAMEEHDSKIALNCPKCSRVMTKYSLAGDVGNRIDLCGNCDEAWLDRGEWALLKSLSLMTSATSIFTENWQRKVRKEKQDASRVARLRASVGSIDTEKAIEVKKWLDKAPHKATIIHYLGSE